MKIEIPEFCLVALVGASSSGKSTFAKKHFKPTEVLSSDYFRGLVSDDENSQESTADAFDALYAIADLRLKNMKLTVVDATNIQSIARKKVIACAKARDCHAAAIVFNMPESVLKARNKERPDRGLADRVIARHIMELRQSLRSLKKEGFRFIYILSSPEEAERVEIVRTKLWNDKKEMQGPFDIIGDVHGCYDELCALLESIGYAKNGEGYTHSAGRKAVFLGDLCDRGPKNAEVLDLVMAMTESKDALCVLGNHDAKLHKYLSGKDVKLSHGLSMTADAINARPPEFKKKVADFTDNLISHYVFDGGRLVVAHAGIKGEYQGRGSTRVRDFCIYGETTGESDDYGLPVRLNWAAEYRGRATVVYGHTPNAEPQILNNTYNIDTGCVFGGRLSAFRYPERQIVSVPAKKTYYESAKPLVPKADAGAEKDDMLSYEDVSGKLIINTDLTPAITINEENSAAALDIMSRFAADPHWLVYLPPTMSPCETAAKEKYLEYPEEAFAYYRDNKISKVVCEKKHMGSRAVIVLAKNAKAAKNRFGVNDGKQGIVYTRTGRHFFDDEEFEGKIIKKFAKVLTESGFWEEFKTDWAAFDTELMPWSVKAQGLLEKQYAPVGCAGKRGLAAAIQALTPAASRVNQATEVSAVTSGKNVDLREVLAAYKEKTAALDNYIEAYREYCWPVKSLKDIKIAPFHLLATEGAAHTDKDHIWHMETIKKYCVRDALFIVTDYITVDVNDTQSVQAGIDWWLALTGNGGEGMVVKPFTYIAKVGGRLLQPAVKCRGREYLRIIYGPEYTLPQHLERLKKRALGRKRSLALREFSLGVESLKRFTDNEPLYRIHQCVFGVLALESEPVDPRL
ncbi:polynucleotide kinase-phosphatase [Clostridia bacterium]|nr:polynucleotide kinase-phosphatase [Clostridia bacterium]